MLRFFSWFRKKRPTLFNGQELEVLTPPDRSGAAVMEVSEAVHIQFRRAQSLDPAYAEAIRTACGLEPGILAAYVLDVRRPEVKGLWIFIELTLEPAIDFASAAQRMAATLQAHADWRKTYIRPTEKATVEQMAGHEFYKRG